MTAGQEDDRRSDGSVSRGTGALRHLHDAGRRSLSNGRRTIALVRRRSGRHASRSRHLRWRMPLLLVATLAAVAFLALDEPAGAYRGQWGSTVGWIAARMTDIGLGVWYVVPAVLALLAANQIDWSRFTGQRLLYLYNWTTLAAYALAAIGGPLLLANIVKRIIGRARPGHFAEHGAFAFDPFAIDASWASFPSGHSATVGGVAGTLVLVWPASRWVVLPAAIWIAATRIVVGAHYPSDVIVGFAFGFACAIGAAIAFARLGYLFRQDGTGMPVRKASFRLLPWRRPRG